MNQAPNSRQSKLSTVLRVTSGNFLEMFDFFLYGFYATYISNTFFPSSNEYASLILTFATFGAGFLMRPLGAVILGAYIDHIGRRKGLIVTLGIMALGTVLIAFVPGYATIGIAAPVLVLVGRLLQGFSAGVELGGVSVYLAEMATPGNKGFYVSWQSASQQAAVVFAGLLGVGLNHWLSPDQMGDWGWRVPFVFGLLVLPIGIYIRRNLAETFHGQGEQASTGSLVRQVFGEHRRALVLGLLILSGSTITQYFINYMTTFALTELKLPTSISMLSTLVAGAAMAVCAIAGGMLCDRFGRRTILMAPRVVLLLVLFPALQLMTEHPSPATFLLTLAVLSGLHGMSGAALIVLLVESFPKAVRSTGFSIVYAFGVAAFGGTAQIIITWLIGTTGNPMSPVGYLLVANLVCLTAAWFAKETRPQSPGRSQPGQRLAEARAR